MFPIRAKYRWPGKRGSFGAVRKHDIHTGVDLYCKEGSCVYAVEDGTVIHMEQFTGPEVGSPWWNTTWAVLVEGKSGIICYGEVAPHHSLEDQMSVYEGDKIGYVMSVLKPHKLLPKSMLHFELYDPETFNDETVWWKLGEEKPKQLLDPTKLLMSLL